MHPPADPPDGNWGRWGPDDERGTLNLLTSDRVRAAVGAVETGQVVSLAQPLDARTPMPHGRPHVAHAMLRDGGDYAIGRKVLGRSRYSDDMVVLGTHSGTHIDGLAHVWYGDRLYNGFEESAIGSSGARRCGVDKLGPLVGRGVLLDLAGHLGVPVLPRRSRVGPDLLAACCLRQGIELCVGDIVLIRTGWLGRWGGDADAYFDGEPGIDVEGAAWLAERDVAAVGADNYAVEHLEGGSPAGFPVHELLLRDHGVPLIEGLVLDVLEGRGDRPFLFMASPLPLSGGTASPVAPVVVL